MKPNRFYLYSLVLVFLPFMVHTQVVLQALEAYNNITFESGKTRIASIYDTDYLPYNIDPRSEALWQRDIPADGTPDPLIDHQGKITTTGFQVAIPISVLVSTTLPAYSVDITVPAAYTEDGNSRTLRFSWEEQAVTYNGVTTHIVATIRSLEGDLLIKKLDMNMGFGADVEGLLLGTFNYPDRYAGAGQFVTTNAEYKLYVVTGIPDRCFGKTTVACVGYGAAVREHDFIYTPVLGPDGKVWLNNNLGAEYARYGSGVFDPVAQAGTRNADTGELLVYPTPEQRVIDFFATGSLFQWQRNPDGHELMVRPYYLGRSGTHRKYAAYPRSVLSTSWTNPNHNITICDYSPSWVTNDLRQQGPHTLWQSGGATNPCPAGYHVPTREEMQALHIAIDGATIVAATKLNQGALLLIEGGLVQSAVYTGYMFQSGWYWTSSHSGTNASYLSWNKSGFATSENNAFQYYSMSIRCIKD
ncbi:FISUMP domain-containing protein [Riemerella anatipestifer]|nr:FISUMP domain-containing protein [Riemerella anatipestifer]MDY3324877.1 FISUMP domain-containing protein [Riemerella anatipestifer]MDY3353687.1 FISUMP domain-containing protein [Riemerella anatipestifer]